MNVLMEENGFPQRLINAVKCFYIDAIVQTGRERIRSKPAITS